MAADARKIIMGGGLAGLACGIRLRELGVEVEVHERRRYPLKKVCGEFLSPRGWKRCLELGVDRHLALPPAALKRARFYYSATGYFDFLLQPQAYGISREALDSALAARFRALGGSLIEESSLESADVDARGKPAESGPARWIGWKGYLTPGEGPAALEEVQMLMLPIQGGYCGLSPVEDGRVSVCFVAQAPASPEALLRSHPLLEALAPRIRPHAAIAGFDFSSHPGLGRIGDARRVWPPLVGDGMSRAMGAGMAWAEGKPEAAAMQALQFTLSKAAHALMLSKPARTLSGPLFKAFPVFPQMFYQLSRG